MTENQRRKFLKLLAAAGITVVTGCSREEADVPAPTENVTPPPEAVMSVSEAADGRALRREELTLRLRELARSGTPADLVDDKWGGVMCYIPADKHIELPPCPECGKPMEAGAMEKLLKPYNTRLARIRALGLNAELTPPEHCPGCGFGLTKGKFRLELRYPDHPGPIPVELDSWFDLELMALFLEKKDRYRVDFSRNETPLRHKVARLRYLFGARADQDAK